MATAPKMSVDAYLRSSDFEPDAEYVDGHIEERPVDGKDHAAWQLAILRVFLLHESEWRLEVLPELRVQVSSTRFRVPDVTVLDAEAPDEQIITHPPVAVFEVLSPEDTIQRMNRKLRDYAAMGIPEIWVADPETASFSRFEGQQLVHRDRLENAARGIYFDLAEIAAMLR